VSYENIECVAIGIGTAGCRIVSEISKSNRVVKRFAYVSADTQDLELDQKSIYKVFINCGLTEKSSPFKVRTYASASVRHLRKLFGSAKVVFAIAGLGGSSGSGIAPLVAKTAKEFGLTVIAVVVMPSKLETHKHFFAGVALRKLRQVSSGVIVIDNDEMLSELRDMPIMDARAVVNERISLAMKKLMESDGSFEFGTGLSKMVRTVVNNHYSVLSLSCMDSTQTPTDSVGEAIRRSYSLADARRADSAILHLVGDKTLSVEELSQAAEKVRTSFVNNSLKLETGFSINGRAGITTILLTSGLAFTKFDDYDPVHKILSGRDLEEEMGDGDAGCSLDAEMPPVDLCVDSIEEEE
jgi:cell division protein FtsZ